MENNILFPSAAAALLREKEETHPGTSVAPDLALSECSSYPVSTPSLCRDHEEQKMKIHGLTESLGLPAKFHADAAKTRYSDSRRSTSESESSSWESDNVKEVYKKRKKKQKKKKKKKKSRKSKEEEVHDGKEYNKEISKPDVIWLEESGLDHSNGFRMDCRPDQHNFEFSSLYKNDIAAFYPPINYQCLGTTKQQSIILYPKKKQKNRKRKSARYFSNVSTLENQAADDNRFINTIENEDFLPLISNKCVIKTEANCTSDVSSDDPLEMSIMQKNKHFSQTLSENPFDPDMWLAFVEYQDELVITSDEQKESFISTPKAIIEKKVSILEKALVSNPSSIKLVIKYMSLVKEIWPNDRVNKQWKDMLFNKIPNNCVLFRHYLLHLQSDISTMKISSVIDAYRWASYNFKTESYPQVECEEEELFILFLQLVIFLWHAGHTEKALCMLQSMVEFNHFCPPDLLSEESSHDESIASFEKFFETESPRFASPGARGWNNFIHNSTIVPDLSPSFSCPHTTTAEVDFDQELEKLRNTKSNKDLWLAMERLRNVTEFLPFQGNRDDCEDTDRIVLSDDVLFSIFQFKSLNLKFQLVLLFLFLLGVPIPLHFLSQKIYKCFSIYYIIKNASSSFACYCHNLMIHDHIMIDSVLLDGNGNPNYKVVTTVRTIFSQFLGCLHSEKNIQQISQIWFHFESFLFRCEIEKNKTCDQKYLRDMKKFIKRLLKVPANRSCVNLWCMYACHEWKIHNTGDSKKIFYTALQMSHADKDDTILKVAKVIRILIDLHLDWKTCNINNVISPTNKSRILNLYVAFVHPDCLFQNIDAEQASPAALWKVYCTMKCIYLSLSDITKNTYMKSTDFLSCYLVFTYLFQGLTMLIDVSNEITHLFFDNQLDIDLSDTLLYALLLMKCDKTTGAFKAYKHLLEKCYYAYPQNERFSTLFNSLKQFGLGSYNTRRFYESILQRCDDLRPWLYAIDYEEKRMKCMTYLPSSDFTIEPGNNSQAILEFANTQTGVHNRIRCLYNTLLLYQDSSKFKYCAEVWIRYLSFLLKNGFRKQATDMLYTALQNCPGSKDIYLFVCKNFDEKFEEMSNLMEEKEIRVKLVMEELEILLEA